MYLYIDETIFNKHHEDYYGVGLFMSEKQIDSEVINEALENLRNDPDIENVETKRMDSDTLRRNYFHSADDSKNAHSHLCRAINKYVQGFFKYEYTKPTTSNKNRTVEHFHRINTKLVSLNITEHIQQIFIFIEQRSSLTQALVEKEIEDLFEEIDKSTYFHPFLSASYPKVTVQIVTKENPGIQVVDFLLWAINNKYIGNQKSRWVDYLGLKMLHTFDQPGGEMAGGEYALNTSASINKIEAITNAYPMGVFPLADEFYHTVDFREIYLSAERILTDIAVNGLPDHANHFLETLNSLMKEIRKSMTTTRTLIHQMAKLFIRLFDTLPIYGGLNKEKDTKEFEKLLHIRRCMGLIISNGVIDGNPAVEVFIEIRNRIITQNIGLGNEGSLPDKQ